MGKYSTWFRKQGNKNKILYELDRYLRASVQNLTSLQSACKPECYLLHYHRMVINYKARLQ